MQEFRQQMCSKCFAYNIRIGSLDAMLATGLYMNDFSMHDTSQEMVLSGIKPLPQLEYARDQVNTDY
jgi:hypothetical protein